MDKKFDRDWFGKIGLFCHEFPGRDIAVHVHNVHTRCRIYRLSEDDFQTADVWVKLRDMVAAEKYEPLTGGKCKNCGVPAGTWLRKWNGRRFCGFCGERYD